MLPIRLYDTTRHPRAVLAFQARATQVSGPAMNLTTTFMRARLAAIHVPARHTAFKSLTATARWIGNILLLFLIKLHGDTAAAQSARRIPSLRRKEDIDQACNVCHDPLVATKHSLGIDRDARALASTATGSEFEPSGDFCSKYQQFKHTHSCKLLFRCRIFHCRL